MANNIFSGLKGTIFEGTKPAANTSNNNSVSLNNPSDGIERNPVVLMNNTGGYVGSQDRISELVRRPNLPVQSDSAAPIGVSLRTFFINGIRSRR